MWVPPCHFCRQTLRYILDEMAKRYALNFLIGSVGASLGGILAFAFIQMHGAGGLEAWR